jgi:TRAP-type mannitol/chloroaromatic compound transport system permease small subunit
MQSLLLRVDRLSTGLGQFFAWLIILLTLMITWEVFSRYALNSPHDWALDAQVMMYGTLFMMAGAYTLAKNSHVRGDVLYGFFRPRTQATLDLILYVLFFLPGIVALTWAGWTFAQESLAIRESTFSATPLPQPHTAHARQSPALSAVQPPQRQGAVARSRAPPRLRLPPSPPPPAAEASRAFRGA